MGRVIFFPLRAFHAARRPSSSNVVPNEFVAGHFLQGGGLPQTH